MTTDLSIRRPTDRHTINLREAWDVSYWCRTLAISESRLRDAVATVGTSADAVRRYLGL